MVSLKEKQVVNLQVSDGITVKVIQNQSHEFLMLSNDVALGYGVSKGTIESHKSHHQNELQEHVHYLLLKNSSSGQERVQVYWTKAGVVRLGFFIKSERAIIFRDWAEKVILRKLDVPDLELPKASKRNHNRLTTARLLEIMADVAMIDDKSLRVSLMQKILPDSVVQGIQLSLPLGNDTNIRNK